MKYYSGTKKAMGTKKPHKMVWGFFFNYKEHY